MSNRMNPERLAQWEEVVRKRGEEKVALKEKLEQAHSLEFHPKRAPLFDKAWEIGHANGDHEVELVYDNLVDLIR